MVEEASADADFLVKLEPCAQTCKTLICAELIISSGILRFFRAFIISFLLMNRKMDCIA